MWIMNFQRVPFYFRAHLSAVCMSVFVTSVRESKLRCDFVSMIFEVVEMTCMFIADGMVANGSSEEEKSTSEDD